MARFGRISVALGTLMLALAPMSGEVAAEATPSFIPPEADWLTTVNYYRAMAGLSPVTEDAALSSGAAKHSCYMLFNGISHDEVPGKTGYTTDGDAAGNSGNVAVSSAQSPTARSFVELWMTGPFHAIGVLRPNLQRSGYGQCSNASTSPWHSGATLDVLRGLGPTQPISAPIVWPGNGTTTNLDRFVVETPDPLAFCGWTGAAGLPVIVQMPEAITANPTASMTGPGGPVQTCVLSQRNTSDVAQSILAGNNAVVVVPRTVLSPGTYSVSVGTSSRTVAWSFTVDPTAATGISPAPVASPTGGPTGLQPMDPTRFVDTRVNSGATRLIGQVPKKILIAGRKGVPANATAISANFTVVNPSGAGYLTLWDCSNPMPTVSSLNFAAGETVANAVTVPLDASGNLCVYSPFATDVLVDVNGYYLDSATSKFVAITPVRAMDTRNGIGPTVRMARGQTVELNLPNQPAGADAAVLNVTTVAPELDGYVTVYPCTADRPGTSSVNPSLGRIRPNTVITPLSDSGTVCLYAHVSVDVIVDVLGYMTTSNATGFTASEPFRLTDTRDRYRTEVNAGTNGNRVGGGQTLVLSIAGTRGIPSSAKSVSVNITVTDATTAGYITAYPCGTRPNTSNVNFEIGAASSNGAMLKLSNSGQLCVYSSSNAHVVVDVNGWWE